MRIRRLSLKVFAILASTPALAQSADPMKEQRCVWACLANSQGVDDPAYEACVEQMCVAGLSVEAMQPTASPATVDSDRTGSVSQRAEGVRLMGLRW